MAEARNLLRNLLIDCCLNHFTVLLLFPPLKRPASYGQDSCRVVQMTETGERRTSRRELHRRLTRDGSKCRGECSVSPANPGGFRASNKTALIRGIIRAAITLPTVN